VNSYTFNTTHQSLLNNEVSPYTKLYVFMTLKNWQFYVNHMKREYLVSRYLHGYNIYKKMMQPVRTILFKNDSRKSKLQLSSILL